MAAPNILFIMTDEQRWDCVGYAGHPLLRTPNLDRLASRGVAFERCYSVNPVCMPARCAIHTGLYTFQTGQMDNRGDWPMNFPTFTQALQRMGYRCRLTGKIHAHEAIGADVDLRSRPWVDELHALGFDDVCQVAGKGMAFFCEDDYTRHLQRNGLLDVYREDIVLRSEGKRDGAGPSALPEDFYIDNFVGQQAVDWLRQYDGKRPFFHMASFCGPHPPFDVYRSALDRIDAARIELPVEGGEEPSRFPRERWRKIRASYLANIQVVDENVGRILDVLEERGWMDNTVIVFTSDHGTMLGDLGKGAKCWWEDPSVRVPLLVSYAPWAAHARRACDTMASNHDVAATILECAAGRDCVSEWLPGCTSRSLVGYITGERNSVRNRVYSEQGEQFTFHWRMVENERFKYVYRVATRQELLFDMSADPHCLNNLAGAESHRDTLHAMRLALLDELAAHPAPKTGKAAHTLEVPHRICREMLRPYRGAEK